MPEWIEAYNCTGVKNKISPSSQELVNKLEHPFIVCSDLTRSLDSAKILGYPSPDLIDPQFREAELTSIMIPIIKLTPHVWSMVYRVFWFVGISGKAESLDTFKLRVSLATEKLIQLAKTHNSVLFIGHGIINRFIAKELISQGWSGEEAPDGNKYWGYKYWEYSSYTKT